MGPVAAVEMGSVHARGPHPDRVERKHAIVGGPFDVAVILRTAEERAILRVPYRESWYELGKSVFGKNSGGKSLLANIY